MNKLKELYNVTDELLTKDKLFVPFTTFVVALLVFTVLLDYSFQLIDAIDWLTL